MDPVSPDDEFLDAVRAFSEASDPLDQRGHGDHAGVTCLRAARDLVLARESSHVLASMADARRHGLPAELIPYGAAIEAAAYLLVGEATAAARLVEHAWGDHPDVAVLPALLGVARLLDGDAAGAAQAMFAALVSDDPDNSLGAHRRLLTVLLERVRAN